MFRRKILGSAALVCLCFFSLPVSAQTKPTKPPPALQQEFNGFIGKFRAAVKSNDPAGVTALTRLPFDGTRYKDAVEFRAKAYPYYFTRSNRACLLRGKAVHSRDGRNNDTYAIFCGELIFAFTKTADGFRFTDVDMND